MKKFFKKVLSIIHDSIGWIFAIPFVISMSLMFVFGLILSFINTKILIEINKIIGINETKEDKEDLTQLKKELECLLVDLNEDKIDSLTIIKGNKNSIKKVYDSDKP